MNQQTIQQVVEEVGSLLTGRYLGKIFQLKPLSLAIDFGLRSGHYLFISSEPAGPRLYLIRRRIKELEKESIPLSNFAQLLRSTLGGATLNDVTKDSSERVVRFLFRKADEHGGIRNTVLLAQLTGRSANLFLLDETDRITGSLRVTKGSGQLIGAIYEPPQPRAELTIAEESLPQGEEESVSAALDSFYRNEEIERSFRQRVKNVQSRLRQEIRQREKLQKNLERDLSGHGDAQDHKRLGELLLANLGTAERAGAKVLIRDFYSEGAPLIELEFENEESSLQEEAMRCFARYTKAKRATEEVARRLSVISQEIAELLAQERALNQISEAHDEEGLAAFEAPAKERKANDSRTRHAAKTPGVRLYRSSDGYEILVGRRAADNDRLTFRLANPNDLWLHSADYPGSHVVVRKADRKDIPHRTIIEAAQLAARFSEASKDSKVVVHYTQRKFLSKPRGAAPGLVRMSKFKTIVVEPKESVSRVAV